jgi:uncharacterized protein (UPF0303 family)
VTAPHDATTGVTVDGTEHARIDELRRQEDELVFAAFEHADAWRLGTMITERALESGYAVAVDIRRPGLILFRAALAGTTADQEEWIRRKSALTLRLESSSALAAARFAAGGVDPAAMGWLDAGVYALAGGSVPVRVRGAGVVAAVTVSGLSSDDDHDLAVECMQRYIRDAHVR